MPNWCSNRLEVFGDTEDLKKFRNDITVESSPEDDDVLDLSKPFPCPTELKDTTATFGHPQNDEHEQQMRNNIEKYGHTDWYEWQVFNWGTKWAPSDIYVDYHSNTHMVLRFDSAWSPPCKLVQKLSELYPSLGFALSFEEGGMAFLGAESYFNGEAIWTQGDDWDSYPRIAKVFKDMDDDDGNWDNIHDAVYETVSELNAMCIEALLEETPAMSPYYHGKN